MTGRVTDMLRKLTSTTSTWATVPLRLIIGGIFIAYGSEKVFGIMGGPGLSAWIKNVDQAPGMRPAWFWLGAAAFSELVGGTLLFLGFLTRLGALLIVPVMTVAMYLQWHAGRSLRYPLAMFAVALALLISGGGQASVDRMISGRR